ncbi:uncharacterized protein [Rutidosis leptorrhynchoides]|uniref:uncharacterized protein n=1 Tax=Rutidosis leptorrhynchoides TaxID=125765 RepID=UPI003A9A0EF9
MVTSVRKNQRRKLEVSEKWENTPITFSAIAQEPSDAPITIKGRVKSCGYIIKRLHVDTGYGVDIMYEHCFRLLPGTAKLVAPNTALSGFSGESAWPIGIIELELELLDDDNKELMRSTTVEFAVVRSYSKYNVLLGRTTLQKLGAIPSTIHGLIKFPTPLGIATIRSEKQDASVAAVEHAKQQPSEAEQLRSCMIIANPHYPEQKIKISGGLSDETNFKLRNILAANTDVFAWKEADMTGVPRDIAEHKLNANPSLTPVRQKKRGMAPERSERLKAEVDKLVKANILREVRYQTWVANPVLVKKPDGSWRMCVDFTDINKACPKDNYPLPKIDWKVESLAGFRYKCFLDAIRANPKKIEAIENMPSPRNKKEVQSLTGKLAALTRFLSKSAERSLPFFGTLKNCLKKTDFKWTEEAETAFQEMKKLLKELPTRTAPIAEEMLILYLAASKEAISSVLIADRGQVQMPVYFISKALTGSELNYPAIEKLVYALVHTARRLRRYF